MQTRKSIYYFKNLLNAQDNYIRTLASVLYLYNAANGDKPN